MQYVLILSNPLTILVPIWFINVFWHLASLPDIYVMVFYMI